MANDGPVIRPTQFEADAIGRLAKSVNMSRGDVNVTKTLVTLPGRPGDATLAVSATIQYGSNVFQQATRWNLDAPTGILGLGWTLPGNSITLQPAGSLAKGAASYVAEIDGDVNLLVEDDVPWVRATIDLNVAKAIASGTVPASLVRAFADHGIALSPSAQAAPSNGGWTITDDQLEHVFEIDVGHSSADVLDGGAAYQLQSYQFWRIAYYEQFERWEITTDTGEVRVFGGGAQGTPRRSAGNSIAWGVKWGGAEGADLGPSMDTSSQAQYARQWNLSSRSDRWGSTVRYGYNEFGRTADGLLGRNVEQRVGGAGGVPYTKAVYPTSITDIFGRTMTFRYGDKTFTSAIQEYMDPHKSLVPAPTPATPPSNLGTPNAYQDRYETLFLESVTVADDRDELLYTLNFAYHDPVAVSTLTGPLATTGAKRYLAAVTETNAFGQALPCYAFGYGTDAQAGPNLGALSSITYPQGATAEVAYRESSLAVCDRSIEIATPDGLGPGAVPFVFYGGDYVASVWVSRDGYTATLDVYGWVGQWVKWSPGQTIYHSASDYVEKATVQAETTDGSFALAFATSAGSTEVFLVARDRNISTQWSSTHVTIAGDNIGLSAGSNFVVATSNKSLHVFTWDWRAGEWSRTESTLQNAVAAIAGDEFYVTATSTATQTTVAIAWLDALASWHHGGSVSVPSVPGYNVNRSMVWDVGGCTLAMVFADDPHGIAYTVHLVTWNADYALSSAAFPHLRAQTADVGHFPWPPEPVVASPRFVGVRQHLFRLDQGTWRPGTCLDVPNGPKNSWLAYAYGPDAAVQVMNTGSDAVSSVTAYDPTAAAFVSTKITTDLPQGQKLLLGWPSVSGDYLIARNALFFRGNSTDWSSAVASPVATLPGSVNGQPVDSRSFANAGPDYLAYLSTPPDPSDNSVQPLVLRNGAVLGHSPQALANTSYSIPVGANPGQLPLGPGSFVTYPAAAGTFSAAQKFRLYRYAGDALSGPITTYPVQSLAIGDGFGGSYDTAYEFDGGTAACDPSGEVVKYFRSASYTGTSAPESGAFGRTVYSFENGYALGSKYSMLDGLLIQTIGCSGAMVFATAWQAAFGLGDDSTPRPVTAELRNAFSSGGVRLTPGAVVSSRDIDGVYQFWWVVDADATYAIDLLGQKDPSGVVRVFDGGPVQSVTTDWDVFTSRSGRPLHGGYARPTQTVTRKDGVPFSTAYGYDDLTGLVATKTWSVLNTAGVKETHVEESVYGAGVYPAMAAANILSPVVAQRHVVTVEDVTSTTSSSATTWQGWRQASGPGLAVQAAAESWAWTGDPAGNDGGEFPFGHAPGPAWKRMSAVTRMSDAGLTLESLDAASMNHSTLYDPSGQVQIASLSNGSFASRQASYSGFEPYEDPTPWTLSGGAEVASGNAHTGSSSLRLPAGSAAKLAALTPDGARPAIFSAWVCTSPDFAAGSGNGWSLTLESGDVVKLRFEPTHGAWSYQSVPVPVTNSVTVAVENGSGTVLVDDVTFVPLTAEYSAQVYDGAFCLPSAKLDEAGQTSRTYRDSFMRPIGGSGATDIPSSIELKYFSATGNAAGFSPGDPNASIGVKAFDGGSYQNVGDWSIEPAGAISTASGAFVHHDTAASATMTSTRPAAAAFALYFETLPVGSGLLELTDDFSIQAGATTLTLSAQTGQWSIGSGRFLGPLCSCLLVQTGDQLMFWANGKLLGSATSVGAVQPSIVTGQNALAISNLILLGSPAVRVVYSDATGAARQDHLVTAESYVLHHTIYDARAEVIVTTKAAPGRFGSGAQLPVPAYRPGFVDVAAFLTSMDQTGLMTGDVAAWYDGTNDTNDQGYPYSRVVLEPAPLARQLELGFPGADHAIVGLASSPRSSRATPQFSYGPSSAVPYLNLPEGEYGTASQLTPSKVKTTTVSDATNGAVGRYTPNAKTTFLSALSTSFGHGDQTVATAQPNGFALGEKGEAERRTRNALQQLIKESSPDGGACRYLYDSAGRIRFFQDASGAADKTLVYVCWDALGRMVARGVADFEWSDSTQAQLQAFADDGAWPENQQKVLFTAQRSWLWDGDGSDPTDLGRLARRRAVTGSTVVTEELSWDGAGRLVGRELSIDDGKSPLRYATTFTYDLRGRLLSVTYPELAGVDFASVHYAYDGRDNIVSIADERRVPFVEYTYDASGAPTGIRYAAGAVAGTQEYDSTGRETALKLSSMQGSYTSTLGYDLDGMVACLQEMLEPAVPGFDADVVYDYDALGRLQCAKDAKTSRSLALDYATPSGVVDQNGNIQSITDGAGATITLDYTPGTNQVRSQMAEGKASACEYAPNGALRQRGSELTIDYVPGMMLPSLVTTPAGAVSFAYDANGKCVTRTTGGGLPAVDVAAGFIGPIATVDPDGTCRALVYGPRGPVAMSTGSKRYSVLCDTLRTPRVAWDASGKLAAAYAYSAYGVRTVASEPGAGFLPLGFTGQRFLSDSGLYDLRTRLYDPAIGRFLAPDPAAQFPSPYCYVGNLPTMLTDPSGQMSTAGAVAIDVLVAALLVAAIVSTAGAAAALVPVAAASSLGTTGAVLAGAAIGAVGGAVSNGLFQTLGYSLSTPPGNWDVDKWGWGCLAAVVGGAAGGALTGGADAFFVEPATAAGTAAADAGADAAATDTGRSIVINTDDDIPAAGRSRAPRGEAEPLVPDRSPRLNAARAPAQRTWEWKELVKPGLRSGATGAAGGALRGYVQAGLNNVFDGRDFNQDVGWLTGRGALTGGATGALGGAFGYANDVSDYVGRGLSQLKSAFSEDYFNYARAVVALSAVTGFFYARTATLNQNAISPAGRQGT